jgi:putative oxidoreductase
MKTIRDAIIIFLAALVVGIAVNSARNALSGRGLPWNTQWKDNRHISTDIEIPPSYEPGDSLLSLRDAYRLYTDKKAIFIDAREPVDFEDGHITGAINFPFEEWDTYWDSVKPKLDTNSEIVAYCGGQDCELSLGMARELKEMGYPKAYIFFGGWEKWKDAGLPTETSDSTPGATDWSAIIIPIILGAYILIILIFALSGKGSLRSSPILFFSRLILGALFIYASYDKILNPLAFAQIIHNYRLLPPSLINLPAMVIPWIEFLAGLFLIIGFRARGADLIIACMLVVYIAMLTEALTRGININCGCFSTASGVKSNLATRIVEDAAMFLLSLQILLFYKTRLRRRRG